MSNKTEWMPEVGQECEFSLNVSQPAVWTKTTITHRGGSLSVGIVDGEEFIFRHATNYTFRPIKTQEETEREKAIKELTSAINCLDTPSMSAEALYDAGYRKQGEVVSSEDVASLYFDTDGLSLLDCLDNFTIIRKPTA